MVEEVPTVLFVYNSDRGLYTLVVLGISYYQLASRHHAFAKNGTSVFRRGDACRPEF